MAKSRYPTDATYDSLKGRNKEYRVADVDGLYMKVQISEKKSWQLHYKNSDGKWTWYGLGAYPEVSLAQARKKVWDIKEGKIELITRKERTLKLKEESQKLFEQLMWDWLDTKKNRWTPENYRKEVQSIKKHLLPKFGKRKFEEIKNLEWKVFFQKKQREEQIFNRLEKLLSYVRNAYDYAMDHGLTEQRNPVLTLKKYLDKGESENMKHVPIQEFPELLRKIRTYPSRETGIGLELLALMFPRPGELRMATWDQFDFELKIWRRPGQGLKGRKDHDIPLSPQVIKLLHELKMISERESRYLFPGRNTINKPISARTFKLALERLGYGDKQDPHGFRHIASTQLNEVLSDKEQVIESCLAHLKGGVSGTYNKGQHFRERIEVMNWWGKYIDSIIE